MYDVFHRPQDKTYLHEVTLSTRGYNFYETSLKPTISKYRVSHFKFGNFERLYLKKCLT